MRAIFRIVGWTALGLIGSAGVALAALYRGDMPYAALEAKYANAQSRYIDMPSGVRVHYRDQGRPEGPPIVLVHGYSASLEAWEPWVSRLRGDYRIVTLDLPGHGLTRAPKGYAATLDSYADIVDGLAEHLKLGRYVVVGNSMGGAVAWDDALRHADRVRGLVLVDAAGWPVMKPQGDGGGLLFAILSTPAGRFLARYLDPRPQFKQGLEQAYHDKRMVTPALLDRYVDLARAPGHRDILLTIDSKPREPVTPETFARIRVPTLVMHGRADALIPMSDGEHFAAAVPGAKLILYDDVGHLPMEQIPDQSAADLAGFLARLPWA